MPANRVTKETIERTRGRIFASKARIEASAVSSAPELQQAAAEVQGLLDSVLDAVDEVVPDEGRWGVAMRFIRRMLSREMIIAVVAIVVIASGTMETEQAIGVAVAAGGLALGRGVAKQRTGGGD